MCFRTQAVPNVVGAYAFKFVCMYVWHSYLQLCLILFVYAYGCIGRTVQYACRSVHVLIASGAERCQGFRPHVAPGCHALGLTLVDLGLGLPFSDCSISDSL